MNFKINLTRKQELALIKLGWEALLDKALNKALDHSQEVRVSAAKASWTPERRKKFAETMKKKFASGNLKVGRPKKSIK